MNVVTCNKDWKTQKPSGGLIIKPLTPLCTLPVTLAHSFRLSSPKPETDTEANGIAPKDWKLT